MMQPLLSLLEYAEDMRRLVFLILAIQIISVIGLAAYVTIREDNNATLSRIESLQVILSAEEAGALEDGD
jgi:hypothetical protein